MENSGSGQRLEAPSIIHASEIEKYFSNSDKGWLINPPSRSA